MSLAGRKLANFCHQLTSECHISLDSEAAMSKADAKMGAAVVDMPPLPPPALLVVHVRVYVRRCCRVC